MKTTFILLGLAMSSVLPHVAVYAQAADVAVPRTREAIVDSALALVQDRSKPLDAIVQPANPFDWPADADAEFAEPDPVVRPAAVMNTALLARIATRIPATGTVNLGGEFILLLGQKRLKVGDSVTISFEGQNYELSIADIASTSFTVTRGSISYTRATHLK